MRRFACGSATDVNEKFRYTCQILNVGDIELKDVMQIGDRRLFRAKILNDDKRKELLLVAKKLKALKEYENVYIQKDLTLKQRQELYERRHGGSGLQGKKRYEKVNDRSSRNGATRHVDYSSIQEVGLDRNLTRGRGRERGRGSRRGRLAERIVGSCGAQGSGRGRTSGEGSGSRQGLEGTGALVDNSLFASVPHQNESLN